MGAELDEGPAPDHCLGWGGGGGWVGGWVGVCVGGWEGVECGPGWCWEERRGGLGRFAWMAKQSAQCCGFGGGGGGTTSPKPMLR